ncbi:MAG TPA: hypothetical protein VJB10_03775 [Candidatus Peribacteraceae bacterium]|nr:hypothetical protein [Candidatus Peribacteraceae bacterium]
MESPRSSDIDLSYDLRETAPTTEAETALDKRIKHFEQTVQECGESWFLPKVHNLLETTPEQQQLKQKLQFPFQLIAANQSFPLKNSIVAERIARRLHIPIEALYCSEVLQNRPHHFGYEDIEDGLRQKGIPIAFSVFGRTMQLASDLDLSKGMNRLFFMHEAFHVPQGVELIQQARFWMPFFAAGLKTDPPKQRVLINQEYPAYGMEVESANVVMGDALRQAALQQRKIDPSTMLTSFNAEADELGWAQMITQLSAAYYPNGSVIRESYPDLFKEIVRRISLRDGFAVYEKMGNNLHPVIR